MKMKYFKPLLILSVIFCLALLLQSYSFSSEKKEKIKWLNIEEAYALYQKEPKPIFIDLYTDWCHWCKVMDKTTFEDPQVVDYMSEHYYAVKFNAESKKPVTFFGKTFKYGTHAEMHDLAVYLTNGNLAFPTSIIIPSTNNNPGLFPGYLKTKDIEVCLKYYVDTKNTSQSFKKYQESFDGSWK